MLLASDFRVRQFMSSDIVTVPSDSVVARAVRLMVEHDFGSVVATEGGRPVGLLTEWDLLRALPRQGYYPEPSLVSDVMKPVTAVVTPESTLGEAADSMVRERGRLIVLQRGELVGMVTATDIIRLVAAIGSRIPIEKVMTRDVVVVGYNTTAGLAIQHMAEKRAGSVLVFKGQSTYGIFTERDVLTKVIAQTLRLSCRVGDLATFPLMTALAGIDAADAARMMTQHKVKRLPIFSGDRLLGIVTARDIVEAVARFRPESSR